MLFSFYKFIFLLKLLKGLPLNFLKILIISLVQSQKIRITPRIKAEKITEGGVKNSAPAREVKNGASLRKSKNNPVNTTNGRKLNKSHSFLFSWKNLFLDNLFMVKKI